MATSVMDVGVVTTAAFHMLANGVSYDVIWSTTTHPFFGTGRVRIRVLRNIVGEIYERIVLCIWSIIDIFLDVFVAGVFIAINDIEGSRLGIVVVHAKVVRNFIGIDDVLVAIIANVRLYVGDVVILGLIAIKNGVGVPFVV